MNQAQSAAPEQPLIRGQRKQHPPLPATAIRTLTSSLWGRTMTPSDVDYDSSRCVYNTMIDRYPAVIAQCVRPEDIRQCLRLAGSHDLPVAIRAGGHSAAGYAVCDGGIVIDLSPMKQIVIDPDRAIARVHPGVTWAELDQASQRLGLAVPGGTVSSTGVAGLTLGGGIGWLMGKYGLTCDSLIGADLVTAEGALMTTNESHNPDLLWGLRGGGGNFGVVTSFVFQLYKVREVLAGSLVIPLAQAGEGLGTLRDLSGLVPDELTVCPTFITADGGKQYLSIDLCYAGAEADGARLISHLARRLHPAANTVRQQPYLQWQQFLDPIFDTPLRGYWKSCFLDTVSDRAIELIIDLYQQAPSTRSTLILEHFHGRMTRLDNAASAYGNRNRPYSILIAARWEAAADDTANIGWTKHLHAAVSEFSHGGGYLNYMGAEDNETVRASYGDSQYQRLVDLKCRYDPGNLFHHNQNIVPDPHRLTG
jgi:hypothetical protein